MPANRLENTIHCIRSALSFGRFSHNKIIKWAGTSLSTSSYVGMIWRPRDAYFLIFGLIWSSGSMAYDIATNPPGESFSPWTALSAGFGLLVIALTFVRKYIFLHKNYDDFGNKNRSENKLSDRFFLSARPAETPTRALNIRDIVAAESNLTILDVPSKENVRNRAAVDLAFSRALLNSQLIRIDPGPNDELMQTTAKDIMSANHEAFSDFQIEALQIMRRKALSNGESFFNAEKISLRTLFIDDEGTARCTIGKTDYFTSCLTNDLSTKCITSSDETCISSAPLSMFPAGPAKPGSHERCILPLSASQHLSNHVGSAVLAVSSDGRPALCYQSGDARINANRAVLSGSGSIDFSDLERSGGEAIRDLATVIRYGMARELLEETGGVPQDSLRQSDYQILREFSARIQIAGYYRDLRRGGLPIFIGFCRMKADFGTIVARRGEQICPWGNPAETKVMASLAAETVTTADEMRGYLERHLNDDKNVAKPSDQLLLFLELLGIDEFSQHFEKALGIGRR